MLWYNSSLDRERRAWGRGVSAGGEGAGGDEIRSLEMDKVLVVVHDFPPLGGSARNRWRSVGLNSLVHGIISGGSLLLLSPFWKSLDRGAFATARLFDRNL
ncbi:MAG: hypothetical protein QXT77_01490 [Candidatus Methanomethylicaceae archaeon]